MNPTLNKNKFKEKIIFCLTFFPIYVLIHPKAKKKTKRKTGELCQTARIRLFLF